MIGNDLPRENFESVYNRIVVKKKLDKNENKNIFRENFEVREITDYNMIMKYEYMLKTCFFSSNINVLKVYRLVNEDYEKEFEKVSKYLNSNILYSIMNINEINDVSERIGEYFTKNFDELKKYNYIIGNTNYPQGFEQNANGIFQVYLFKLIPNKTFLLNKTNYADIDNNRIPDNYDSIAIERNLYYEKKKEDFEKKNKERAYSNGNNSSEYDIYKSRIMDGMITTCGSNSCKNGLQYSYLYKVKNSEQLLPLLLIKFEFKCLRVDISIPICESCSINNALYYCYNDKVHLCDICDIKHHDKNKILKNHKRIHISESPFQFGKCPYHPSELVETICMKCFCSLCSNCLLIGNHSKGSYRNHPIMNIKEAYILSNQKKSLSDISIENRKIRVLNLLKKKHKLLSEIYSNYASLQKRIDTLYEYIMSELKKIKKKKINFLMALKRSVLSEMLIIEWMEAFFFHAKLSLNLSDFILYQKKHELLTQFLNSKTRESNLFKYIPEWVFQKININSSLSIYEDSFYKVGIFSGGSINGADLKINEEEKNKPTFLCNFNNIFDQKNNYFTLYDDNKIGKGNEDENVKYSKLISKENEPDKGTCTNENPTSNHLGQENMNELDYHMANIEDTKNFLVLNELDKNTVFSTLNNGEIKYSLEKDEIKEIDKIKKEYSMRTFSLTSDKIINTNLLFSLFKNRLSVQAKTLNLKNSYIYKELWKQLLNYKYINIIHILKATNNFNNLGIFCSFLNISNYYDSLEDFTKYVIKHEIYTLLNKNINYDAKMKLTKLLDNIVTLLSIQGFKLSTCIDRYINMCFSDVHKNENNILLHVKDRIMNDNDNDNKLYEDYIEHKKKTLNIINDDGMKLPEQIYPDLKNEPKNSGKFDSINDTAYDENTKDIDGESVKENKMDDEAQKRRLTIDTAVDEIKRVINDGGIKNTSVIMDNHDDSFKYDNLGNEKENKEMKKQSDVSNIGNIDANDSEKEEFFTLKKIKEYIFVYIEKLINDLINVPYKDLNDSIRFIFYTIHDEIDGTHSSIITNKKKISIHTLTLCLDLFINSIIYHYIFYVHEKNVNIQMNDKSLLHQKVILLFGETLREISIYIFQIYNLGVYDNNLTTFINNIKNNKMLIRKATNENMFFMDVSQKLFKWMLKNLESPRYYAPIKWSYNEDIEKSYRNIVREIIKLDKLAMENCTNENVDYNILFSTTNFKEILDLCYSVCDS
ncbi:Krueppel-like protein [Plasmodium yoelii yoelii]|uniref:Zinc finger protein n=3 Tax=Plasmodium yoelii TaxID=5861 RepID=A0AAE9WSW5_PLAYO|nr:Krueppel-like protein [Plasmodium yoelii yoelii]WBY59733.1 zinc finger protein [Plasmodium yoelii yoelii]